MRRAGESLGAIRRWRPGLAALAVLAGLAAGWQWFGMRLVLGAGIDPSPGTSAMAAGLALLAASLGPWLPERLLLAGLRATERWHYPREEQKAEAAAGFWLLRCLHERDPAMLWLAAALLASASGLLSLVTLFCTGPALRLYGELPNHFLWTDLTLSAVEWAGAAVLIAPSWALAAVVLSTLEAAISSGREALSGARTMGHVLLGFAIAWAFAAGCAVRGLSGTQVYLLGVLPMFGLAAAAAMISQRFTSRPQPEAATEPQPPEMTPRGEGLIWMGLVLWGLAAALVFTGWAFADAVVPGWALPAMLAITVLAVHAWSQRHSLRQHRCGSSIWLAGVCTAGVAAMAGRGSTGLLSGWVEAVLLVAPLGYALHETEFAWLIRAGRESLAFGQSIHAVCIGLAIGLVAGHSLSLPGAGPVGTIALGSVVLMGLAVVVLLYEHQALPETRGRRLAASLASIAIAALILPAEFYPGKMAAALAAPAAEPLDSDLLTAISANGRGRRICLIGVGRPAVPPELARQVSLLPRPDVSGAAAPGKRIGRTPSSFRRLRLERNSYDMIYQRGPAAGDAAFTAMHSFEWLQLLAACGRPGAQIVLDIPLSGLTSEAVKIIAATCERALGSGGWQTGCFAGGACLRLTCPLAAVPPQARPLSILAAGAGGVHSLNCDHLSRGLASGSPAEGWLQSQRAAAFAGGSPAR